MEAARKTENKDLRSENSKYIMGYYKLVSMYFGPMTLTFTLVDHHGP
jgi:hypothetical protein